MPVEDASVQWPEDESPYRAVARLVLPQQDAMSEARLRTYGALVQFRQGRNGNPTVEPTSLSEIPD